MPPGMWDPSVVDVEFTLMDVHDPIVATLHEGHDSCIDAFGDCLTHHFPPLPWEVPSVTISSSLLPRTSNGNYLTWTYYAHTSVGYTKTISTIPWTKHPSITM